eukprot:CAMPEP_0170553334 /NCGR_PEP_ID=MMETSP0211-20121228/11151_1 /TAXON_ID=311385 /ORGANISM="Pseudokeronopsis sp., Strain OXSARD2" /LENGTH=36 /DNA_ID= /DNA_START= /DNA_END= /DNA_ORIENTATION=
MSLLVAMRSPLILNPDFDSLAEAEDLDTEEDDSVLP